MIPTLEICLRILIVLAVRKKTGERILIKAHKPINIRNMPTSCLPKNLLNPIKYRFDSIV